MDYAIPYNRKSKKQLKKKKNPYKKGGAMRTIR